MTGFVCITRRVGGSLGVWNRGQPYRAGRPPESSLTPDAPETYAEAARVLTEEWGFRCLKVHFGPGAGLEITSQVEAFGEKFAAVCEGAGPDADVAVDIHNPHPAIAKQLIEVLAPSRTVFCRGANAC